METTYSVTEAQAGLPALLKRAQERLIVITKRDKPVAYLVSAERMMAIAETLEIMADPAAMRAIRKAQEGKGTYMPLTALGED